MRLKGAFAVHAGIIPGIGMAEFCKEFLYTSEDYEADQKLPPMPEGYKIDMNGPLDQPHMSRFTRLHMEAMRYYSGLVSPAHLNWAQISWIWY
jgi:hypothetical protein